MKKCSHLDEIRGVTPSAKGCEELPENRRLVGSSAPVPNLPPLGCCDDSPNRHARAHFHKTQHPIIEGYYPAEGWGWCYVEELYVELPDQTPQLGPIPRFV